MRTLVAHSPRGRRAALTTFAGSVAASAWFGAIGMVSGLLPVEATLADRLPFDSPVFGGIALALVVAVPTTVASVLEWRGNARAGAMLTLAGVLLVGWIAVEIAVVRQFSPLQVICAVAGAGLALVGDRATLRQIGAAATAAPLFLVAPLLRHWHLRWGATGEEVRAQLPGDELVPVAQFIATRAITIKASPEAVWPWLVQIGFGRGGFYSYDLLDNLGRPSAEFIQPAWQHPAVGDVAAPMANPPTTQTSFVVADVEPAARLVWSKPDSTWSWTLHRLPSGHTRLVTRLKQRYRCRPSTLVTIVLAEFGDFPMMRRMLLGIRQRAERSAGPPADDAPTPPDQVELYWLPLGAGGHVVRWNGRLYEAFAARREHRVAQPLYHSALQLHVAGQRYVIEMAPVWNERTPERGVAGEGPVGTRWLGRSRAFRYEVRRWHDGRIPDVDEAVESPQLVSTDPATAAEILDAAERVPVFTWGRDELHCGDMWNSNSLTSWLLATAGIDMTTVNPPHGGRAPGWHAGLVLAARESATDERTLGHVR